MAKKKNEELARFLDAVNAFQLPLIKPAFNWYQINGKLLLTVEWPDGAFDIMRPASDTISTEKTFQAVREYAGLTEE